MRSVLYYTCLWTYLFCSMCGLLCVLLLRALGKDEEAHAFAARRATAWGKAMVRLSGGTFTVEGLEHIPSDAGVMLCSNHQGAFDIPLLLAFVPRPVGFVAKQELRKLPFVGWWMRQLNCLFLDRQNPRQALGVMREGVALLKKGAGLVVFPEGTRSGSSTLAEFRQGSLRMAVSAGAPVVPVTIIDSYLLREAQGRKIRPAAVRIVFSPPIATAGLSRPEKKDLLNRVRETMQSNLRDAQSSADAQ